MLWKRNVSIAATLFVAAPIKNSVLISAGIITITGLTAISNNFVRNVHGLLRKNRRILADLYTEDRVKGS